MPTLKFLGEGSVGWGWHTQQWKTCPQNIGTATEIASISVSVSKLLVLPVWGTVSTYSLHLMVFSIVGQCRCRWKWIARVRKLCSSRWDLVEMSSHRLVITTSGFGDFYFRLAYAVRKSQQSHWQHGYTRHIFISAARLTELRLKPVFQHLGVPFVSHQKLGTATNGENSFRVL